MLVVEVTEKDIEYGQPGGNRTCPIALAASRAGLPYPMVERNVLLWGGKAQKLPARAINFIERFDLGIPVSPFDFVVMV